MQHATSVATPDVGVGSDAEAPVPNSSQMTVDVAVKTMQTSRGVKMLKWLGGLRV